MESLLNLAGPLLIGYLLNLCLLGILFVQIFIYSAAFNTRHSRDNLSTKTLVYGVLLLEIIQSAFVLRDAYVTFARGYGDVHQLEKVQFTWLTMPILSGIVGCIVQAYYAFRIHIFMRGSYILPTLIVLMAITQCVAAITVGFDEYLVQELSWLSRVGRIANIIWPVVSAACDVTIAIATFFYIMKLNLLLNIFPGNKTTKAHSSFQLTRTLLSRALHLSVETGALTEPATFSVLYVVLWATHRNEYYYMTFAFIMGKIYANSLMAIFNSRVLISDLRDQPRTIDSSGVHHNHSLFCNVECGMVGGTSDGTASHHLVLGQQQMQPR